MKTLTDCIRQTTKSDEPWAVEWACQTIVCSDVKDYLCRVGAPILDAMLFELAAQAVNFVDHFEHQFDYVDFSVRAEPSNGDWVPVRVSLDLAPEPLVTISLTPNARVAGRMAKDVAA